jgi:hypothetical protein
MRQILDLDRYPLDRLDAAETRQLMAASKAELAAHGMFNLPGLVRQSVIEQCAAELEPLIDTVAFTHKRRHNIYFRQDIEGLAPDHPALRRCDTINHTLCGDQLAGTIVGRIYEWTPLVDFLARVMDKPRLFLMADPLARVNVMGYRAGEALNWHFDRSEFTTTLLIQSPEAGGEFEYRSDLRTDDDPNYDGVARLLRGEDDAVRSLSLKAGTLNVFKGRNTAHRVTPAVGGKQRIVAVFSYYERPGVQFSREERVGFYGRAG